MYHPPNQDWARTCGGRKWTVAFGHQSAWSLSSEQLELAAQAMLEHGYSPATANRDLSIFARWEPCTAEAAPPAGAAARSLRSADLPICFNTGRLSSYPRCASHGMLNKVLRQMGVIEKPRSCVSWAWERRRARRRKWRGSGWNESEIRQPLIRRLEITMD
jgi:hypothetical protein